MNSNEINRRRFIGTVAAATAGVAVSDLTPMFGKTRNVILDGNPAAGDALKISVFDMDATPPIGSYLTYDQMENVWDLGLRAKGLVLTGAGDPIVICAIDWIGIANESQDVFKKTLADAVHTDPKRVVVHTLHQHDAPLCDFSAEKMLKEMGIEPMS